MFQQRFHIHVGFDSVLGNASKLFADCESSKSCFIASSRVWVGTLFTVGASTSRVPLRKNCPPREEYEGWKMIAMITGGDATTYDIISLSFSVTVVAQGDIRFQERQWRLLCSEMRVLPPCLPNIYIWHISSSDARYLKELHWKDGICFYMNTWTNRH